jgi:hypothetical protein
MLYGRGEEAPQDVQTSPVRDAIYSVCSITCRFRLSLGKALTLAPKTTGVAGKWHG